MSEEDLKKFVRLSKAPCAIIRLRTILKRL